MFTEVMIMEATETEVTVTEATEVTVMALLIMTGAVILCLLTKMAT